MSEPEFPAKSNKKSSWEKTGEKRLLRNTLTKQYYFRYTLNGKQKWVWLNTDVYATARLRLLDKLREMLVIRASSKKIED